MIFTSAAFAAKACDNMTITPTFAARNRVRMFYSVQRVQGEIFELSRFYSNTASVKSLQNSLHNGTRSLGVCPYELAEQ